VEGNQDKENHTPMRHILRHGPLIAISHMLSRRIESILLLTKRTGKQRRNIPQLPIHCPDIRVGKT
jgi:hypothetical protein